MLYHVFTKLSSYSYVTIFYNKTIIINNILLLYTSDASY